MTGLFASDTARGIWTERWCDTCCQPDEVAKRLAGAGVGCPIIAKAVLSDRKPREWDRNNRAQTMDAAYKCNAYTHRPPVNRRAKANDETLSLFAEDELDHADGHLVPVDGWPDYRARGRKDKGGAHA
jgi:hypothetical protein